MGFSTDAVHAGQEVDAATGAVSVPIYQTSTYKLIELGKTTGYDYARTINPTRSALERSMAALEKGKAGFAFASGMAAINAIFSMLSSGDHVVLSQNVYGGTFRLINGVLKNFSLGFSFVDTSDIRQIEEAMTPATKMVFVETPTNPVLSLTDIQAVAALCRARSAALVVDNTFMSPCLQSPIPLGADMVVHSTTKFINGHSDSIGGAVVAVRDEHVDRLRFIQKSAGAVLSPFDSWLVLRGIKTLGVRMERHETNARMVADFLDGHSRVKRVLYPGLDSHPQHELARRQGKGFGAMITFELDGYAAVKRFLDSLSVCTLAESLGGVETLISHPATMTHASVPAEERKRIGITDSMVRIAVGIEDAEDLIADLDSGLTAVGSSAA